jgi:hypothetical protein
MEKRVHKRKIVDFNVELLVNGIRYAGNAENMSRTGLYVIINPSGSTIDIASGTELELKFQLSSGQLLNIPCQVKWTYKTPPHGLTYSIGMEILKPSAKYMEFFNDL